MDTPAEVQVLRALAKMKGPQTLCLLGSLALLVSGFLQVGFQSFFQHICSAAPCNWHGVSARNGTRGKKNIVEEDSRMNDGNLSVLVHHEDLLIKFLTLQKHHVAKLEAELLSLSVCYHCSREIPHSHELILYTLYPLKVTKHYVYFTYKVLRHKATCPDPVPSLTSSLGISAQDKKFVHNSNDTPPILCIA